MEVSRARTSPRDARRGPTGHDRTAPDRQWWVRRERAELQARCGGEGEAGRSTAATSSPLVLTHSETAVS